MESRVAGLDTLAEAVDKMRTKTTPGYVCIACYKILRTIGYKFFVASTISEETQTEPWEVVTQESIDDTIIT